MFPNLDDENLGDSAREWLKTMPDNKVFEWLGNDSENIPNYLHLLNLNWSRNGVDSDLQLFRQVARRLAEEPSYLRQMIRTVFWRHTIVACISVILLNAKEYCADLKDSFNQRNFVSPQIAVALGLLCPSEAVLHLTEVVRNAKTLTVESDPKKVIAAQTVLAKLEPKLAAELASSDVFEQYQKHIDGETGRDVAELHWEFWRGVN